MLKFTVTLTATVEKLKILLVMLFVIWVEMIGNMGSDLKVDYFKILDICPKDITCFA